MARFFIEWLDFKETLQVQTSGSTGKPKLITISKHHMINSALATGAYFQMGEEAKALLCLSSEYIAGKMMLVRAMVLGWNLDVIAPEKEVFIKHNITYDFVAMVPYQLYHSISVLSKVKKLIIGGGIISPEIEKKLQKEKTEVYATYGMTETITHVAIKRINGTTKEEVFRALPEVVFSLDDRGCLVIEALKVSSAKVVTNDLVNLISPVSFRWLGRFDYIINTGGVKVCPEKVEKKIAPYINENFIITSENDPQLGQRVILIIESKTNNSLDYQKIVALLPKFERPKKVYTISQFPYTKTGKIKRTEVLSLLKKE